MQESVHPAREGNAPPPKPPEENNGGDSRGHDRGTVMRLIYTDKGGQAASLDYLRRRANFPYDRMWRAFEDLEDIGYVERLRPDPRGKVARWLDNREDANGRVFASIFVYLTEAGWHSPELADSIAALEETSRHNECGGQQATISIREELRGLLSRPSALHDNVRKTLLGRWRTACYHQSPKCRADAWRSLFLYAVTASGIASLPGGLALLAAN